jgi:hypothetical protein
LERFRGSQNEDDLSDVEVTMDENVKE